MADCYANENLPLPVVEALRQLGHNLLTTYESGKAGQAVPDEEILAFAGSESRIVLTLNRRHFIRLHRAAPNHSGIIVCTYDPDFEALANRIHEELQAYSDWAGRLVRINRPA
ncbi:MAG: DUF5615 family PIN-like protein [Candidatus Tectomicrobia bacterium]|nr:DUF5615 family PIN-like protein [Candidatus Tectomicrobia bacterium]